MKVRAGEPFQPSASVWNRMIELTNRHDARLGRDPLAPTGGTVLVKNNSGGTVNRLGILGINGIVFDQTDDDNLFSSNQITLTGTTPTAGTYSDKFAIAAQPIADGEIGRCWMSGVCPVHLEVDKTWHEYCDVKGSTTELKTYPGGGAKIIWQQSGTGTGKHAVVRFGSVPQVICEFDLDAALATTDASKGATIAHCTIPGYNSQTITVTNHTASTNKIFEGDINDYGTAYYDVNNDKWYIIQMECP